MARTFRKVAAPGGGGGGGDAGISGGGGPSERVQVTLRLRVGNVDYDPDGPSLRVGGVNTSECEHVRLGAHHTLELAPGRAFTLEKEALRGGSGGGGGAAAAAAASASSGSSPPSSLGGWDGHDLDRLRRATNPAATADLAALLLAEGLATLVLVGGATTTLAAKVEAALPRKSGKGGVGAANAHPKALAAFFDRVVSACSRKVDFAVVKCLVVAGPGFTKDAFRKHLEGLAGGAGGGRSPSAAAAAAAAAASAAASAPSPETATPGAFAAAALPRLVLAHASCAYKHALREVLSSKAVASQIQDTAAAREAAALGALFETLAREPSRAFYGPGHVAAAAELGAIKTLMLSDSLFRVTTAGGGERNGGGSAGGAEAAAVDAVKRRAGWEALAEGVRSAGGEVLIFSAAHSTGADLDKITGCAALLRFPAPQLEDLELEDEVGKK